MLHGGRGCFNTARTTIREHRQLELSHKAANKWAESHGHPGWSSQAPDADAGPSQYDALIKLWCAPSGRYRVERAVTAGPEAEPYTRLFDGVDEWYYAPSSGIFKNPSGIDSIEGGILLDPTPLLAAFDFDEISNDTQLDRDVKKARIKLRERNRLEPGVLQELGLGADHYELTVDAERGVLLRFAALLDDVVMFSLTVEEIVFDQDLDDGLFQFDVPPETPVVDASAVIAPVPMSLEQAAQRAEFLVHVPARAPEHTSLQVSFQEGSVDPIVPEQIYLMYAFPNGAHSLLLTQAASGQPLGDRTGTEWTVLVHDGLALRHRDHGAHREIEVEREGTRVRIASDLELDTLVELARSLEPAPTEPPRLVAS